MFNNGMESLIKMSLLTTIQIVLIKLTFNKPAILILLKNIHQTNLKKNELCTTGKLL